MRGFIRGFGAAGFCWRLCVVLAMLLGCALYGRAAGRQSLVAAPLQMTDYRYTLFLAGQSASTNLAGQTLCEQYLAGLEEFTYNGVRVKRLRMQYRTGAGFQTGTWTTFTAGSYVAHSIAGSVITLSGKMAVYSMSDTMTWTLAKGIGGYTVTVRVTNKDGKEVYKHPATLLQPGYVLKLG